MFSKITFSPRRWLKNLMLYGVLFLALSMVVDQFRKPNEPSQFAQQILYDTQHSPHIIAQLSHEKTMLVYFWGTWCVYCKFTSPQIQQFMDNGTPVLTVALKSGSDNEINQYLQENRYKFATINDQFGDISSQWNIQVTPTILIIKNGHVLKHTTGLTSYWGLKIRMWLAEMGL